MKGIQNGWNDINALSQTVKCLLASATIPDLSMTFKEVINHAWVTSHSPRRIIWQLFIYIHDLKNLKKTQRIFTFYFHQNYVIITNTKTCFQKRIVKDKYFNWKRCSCIYRCNCNAIFVWYQLKENEGNIICIYYVSLSLCHRYNSNNIDIISQYQTTKTQYNQVPL